MPRLLFSDFLTSKEDLDGAMAFWGSLFDDCAGPEERGKWKPWLGIDALHGPIFSVVHVANLKGISVHQKHYLSEVPYFDVVTRVYGESDPVGPTISHLMILCELSEEIVPQAKRTISDFICSVGD